MPEYHLLFKPNAYTMPAYGPNLNAPVNIMKTNDYNILTMARKFGRKRGSKGGVHELHPDKLGKQSLGEHKSLRSDQRLCFRYTDSTIPLIS